MKKLIAKWETSGKKFWIALYKAGPYDYRYETDNGGGALITGSDSAAITACEDMVREAKDTDNINMKRKATA